MLFQIRVHLIPDLHVPLVIAISIVLSTAIGILGVKSFVEVILYAQPMVVRIAKNVYAFVADVVVLTVSLPICVSLRGIIRKLFPQESMV